jgi:replication factor C subunit 3/5
MSQACSNLLIDKYAVRDKEDLRFEHHKNTFRKLVLNQKGNFRNLPNLLVHGPQGSGKKTLIYVLLKELFGEEALNTRKEEYSVVGYGNSNVLVEIEQSNYHIVIEPNNSGFDKYLIQEIVTEYAKRQSQFVASKAPFKIVFINNVDNLSYYAQTSLRCTMERYQNNCKFILCAYQVSKIIEPLRSRCLDVRIPRPSNEDIIETLWWIAAREGFKLPFNVYTKILYECNRDVKAAIWMLEMYRKKIPDFTLSWKVSVETVTNLVYNVYKHKKHITLANIAECRSVINNILITNIPGTDIMACILEKLINSDVRYPDPLLHAMIEKVSEFENRLSKGKRSIIHFEGLIINLLYLAFSYNEDTI